MTDTSKPTTTAPAMTTPDQGYHPEAVEAKWQARWAERGTNEPDLERAERPFFNLMMFPYPSAEGLHVGNMFAFTGADVYGRFKRLQGYDVFEPIGYDAFGIHSENYAIKQGINPSILIPQNIANFRRQLVRIGGMFDLRHELSTTDPRYYWSFPCQSHYWIEKNQVVWDRPFTRSQIATVRAGDRRAMERGATEASRLAKPATTPAAADPAGPRGHTPWWRRLLRLQDE